MNIVYIEHYAGTPALGMEFRPYYLAREWVRAGHRVQMLAASYSHVRARQPEVGGDLCGQAVGVASKRGLGRDERWLGYCQERVVLEEHRQRHAGLCLRLGRPLWLLDDHLDALARVYGA